MPSKCSDITIDVKRNKSNETGYEKEKKEEFYSVKNVFLIWGASTVVALFIVYIIVVNKDLFEHDPMKSASIDRLKIIEKAINDSEWNPVPLD